MNTHRDEPVKITAEIPVSINLLSLVNNVSIQYLKVKGLFYVTIGLTWIFFNSPARLAGIKWLSFLDERTVGLVWLFAGCVSVGAAFIKDDTARRIGFFMLISVSAVMGAYFFISGIAYYIPYLQTEGYSRASINAVSYWAYSASAYLMARVYILTSGAPEIQPSGGRA